MKKDTPKKEKTRKIGKGLPSSAAESLEDLRQNIDSIDREILEILVKRQSQVEQMVFLKKKYNLPVYHPAREEDMISERRRLAKEAGLDPDYLAGRSYKRRHPQFSPCHGHLFIYLIDPV